ncbi:MAG: Bug family tripartite tricarboxylate transporter substrate binding protein [Hyphomicrobiaceae bacterium]
MEPGRASYTASAAVLGLALASSAVPAAADTVADFYKGKTVEVIIGYPPGGSNNLFGRSVARLIGKYLPGNPQVIPRNMPGGGSLIAANYMYKIAPKDGTAIAIVSPTVPLDETVGKKQAQFKSAEFNWIGRTTNAVNPLFIWHTQPYKSWKEALTKEITLSATGASSTVAVYPNLLNNVVGTKFKLIMGYKGSGTSMLAVERGEVAGHSTAWEALKSQHPDWLREKKVRILLQFALKRHPEMQDVPTAIEIAKTDEQKAVLSAVLKATELGKPFLAPPGVPKERVQALRRAFDKVVEDQSFVDEYKKSGIDLYPIKGEELQKLVAEVTGIKGDLLAKVKAGYGITDGSAKSAKKDKK